MLTSLRIENFAIVDILELDFSNGMTAFTGETGAGKSIMIDALMLALGERADTSVIRIGSDKCDIQARFSIDKLSSALQWLVEHDIESGDYEIILRRVMFAEGRSKSYINGVFFPLQKIKELSEHLVDIHGQHQHQTLLKHATHRLQLDQYANNQEMLDNVNLHYRQCHILQSKLDELKQKTKLNERADLLKYQLDELDGLALKEDESHHLHKEHQFLHNSYAYLEQAQFIMDLLQSDEKHNISQWLHQITQSLSTLPNDNSHISNTIELMNNALIQCDEALNEMTYFANQIPLNHERLNIVESRISELHQMARKYHVDVSQLSARAESIQKELLEIQQTKEILETIEQDYAKAQKEYKTAAMKLRKSRIKHAINLAKEITLNIQQLGMPHGFIELEITPLDTIHSHGMDKVEYKVCTNIGMRPDSLAKIASGGELSRISLGIQMITAQRSATPSLLFDEVDVGIGGGTATLVGQLLRKLGERIQVFCVTHQPQVASNAHNHFVVEKHTHNQQTFSRIKPVIDDEKIDEIARMLGGLTITEQSRLHAIELIKSATLI